MAPFHALHDRRNLQNLTGEESVHLSDWPRVPKINSSDIQLIEDMKMARK